MVKEKEGEIRVNGEVIEALPNTNFRVELEDGRAIIAHLSGKMRQNWIKVLPGDWVAVALSLYNFERGRIVSRLNVEEARTLSKAKQDRQSHQASA